MPGSLILGGKAEKVAEVDVRSVQTTPGLHQRRVPGPQRQSPLSSDPHFDTFNFKANLQRFRSFETVTQQLTHPAGFFLNIIESGVAHKIGQKCQKLFYKISVYCCWQHHKLSNVHSLSESFLNVNATIFIYQTKVNSVALDFPTFIVNEENFPGLLHWLFRFCFLLRFAPLSWMRTYGWRLEKIINKVKTFKRWQLKLKQSCYKSSKS